jgi:hypothetical protein
MLGKSLKIPKRQSESVYGFQQTIAMSHPLFADLFLYLYEAVFIQAEASERQDNKSALEQTRQWPKEKAQNTIYKTYI